jgi:hypothetical protein
MVVNAESASMLPAVPECLGAMSTTAGLLTCAGEDARMIGGPVAEAGIRATSAARRATIPDDTRRA